MQGSDDLSTRTQGNTFSIRQRLWGKDETPHVVINPALRESRTKSCTLCRMTVTAIENATGESGLAHIELERPTKKCQQCALYFHAECERYWHTEHRPYSRLVVRVAKSSGTVRVAKSSGTVLERDTVESLASLPPALMPAAQERITMTQTHKQEQATRTGVCKLCKVTRVAAAGQGDGADGSDRTDTMCAVCKVFLHPDCHVYWHTEAVPYSRHVTGTPFSPVPFDGAVQ
eukprot:3416443-Rhodomonas_salina.2